MRTGIRTENIMADGTVCRSAEELAEYGRYAELPDIAKRLITDFIETGAALNGKTDNT